MGVSTLRKSVVATRIQSLLMPKTVHSHGDLEDMVVLDTLKPEMNLSQDLSSSWMDPDVAFAKLYVEETSIWPLARFQELFTCGVSTTVQRRPICIPSPLQIYPV